MVHSKQLDEDEDEDEEDSLSMDQFIDLMAQKMAELDGRSEIMVAFKLFDLENKGKISLKDLRKVAKELGEEITEEELQMIMHESDRDGDGEIGEEDWVKLFLTV